MKSSVTAAWLPAQRAARTRGCLSLCSGHEPASWQNINRTYMKWQSPLCPCSLRIWRRDCTILLRGSGLLLGSFQDFGRESAFCSLVRIAADGSPWCCIWGLQSHSREVHQFLPVVLAGHIRCWDKEVFPISLSEPFPALLQAVALHRVHRNVSKCSHRSCPHVLEAVWVCLGHIPSGSRQTLHILMQLNLGFGLKVSPQRWEHTSAPAPGQPPGSRAANTQSRDFPEEIRKV